MTAEASESPTAAAIRRSEDQQQKELHIAPMLDVSTREFRYLMRLLTRSAILWTEMVVDETLVHCHDLYPHLTLQDRDADDVSPSPVVCQIGGNRPEYAKVATELVKRHGYDGIDLNCECPSHRVASSREFGAALMKNPSVAVRMVSAIREALGPPSPSSLPIDDGPRGRPSGKTFSLSVKMRIGVDDEDSWEFLSGYVRELREQDCRRFVVHARKVYTQGLNPDQNRRVPPLDYRIVYRLCDEFPDCDFILNGGIQTLRQAKALLFGSDAVSDDENEPENEDDDSRRRTAPRRIPPPNLRGVMMGRAARDDPIQFWDADRYLFGDWDGAGTAHAVAPSPAAIVRNRRELLEAYCAYLERLYPRRCCDDDHDRITSHFPAPRVVHTSLHCLLCRPEARLGGGDADDDATSGDTGNNAATAAAPADTKSTTTAVPDPALNKDGDSRPEEAAAIPPSTTQGRRWRKLQKRAQQQQEEEHQRREPPHPYRVRRSDPPLCRAAARPVKVSSNVIDRSFRPVWGIARGEKGCKKFRQALFDAGRDLSVRNCGPAHILRTAASAALPAELLDRPFEPTRASCRGRSPSEE
jgi:tRNA-dihydrouridine synthase A